jgi:hypothetical protein
MLLVQLAFGVLACPKAAVTAERCKLVLVDVNHQLVAGQPARMED